MKIIFTGRRDASFLLDSTAKGATMGPFQPVCTTAPQGRGATLAGFDEEEFNDSFFDEDKPSTKAQMKLINSSIAQLSVEQVIAQLKLAKANIQSPKNAAVFTDSTRIIAAIDGVFGPLNDTHNAVLQHNDVAKSLTSAQQAALLACAPVMADVADYGEKCASGDKAKAQLLGLPLHKDKTPVTLTKPHNFSISTGDQPGRWDWHCDTMDGVHYWEFEFCPDPLTPTGFALKATSTESKGTVEGLPSTTQGWGRIRPVGGKNVKGPYSDPLCRIVP